MEIPVFRPEVGKRCAAAPGCILMRIAVAGGRYVPVGTVLQDQSVTGKLPAIIDDCPRRSSTKGCIP